MQNNLTAVIVDDEEPLRHYLRKLLATNWPELLICGEAENGIDAVELITSQQPAVVFLDIQMPGLNGIEVVRQIPAATHTVFVTAYDSYAVAAFENEAIDYLLKPVTADRLEKTIGRLKARMEQDQPNSPAIIKVVEALFAQQAVNSSSDYLKWIRAQQGDGIKLIATDEIVCFRAEDKYTCVVTLNGESLIRTPIKDLAAGLDPDTFWQINRGEIVRVDQISKVSRSLTGRYVVKLKNDQLLTVSRNYAHLFRQM